MANLTLVPLSGSTDFKGILVTGTTATDGTTIHTAATGQTAAGQGDQLVLYAFNSATQVQTLTLTWGGTTSPNDHIKFLLPTDGMVPLVAGMMIRNGLTIRAGATTASAVAIHGYVTRAT